MCQLSTGSLRASEHGDWGMASVSVNLGADRVRCGDHAADATVPEGVRRRRGSHGDAAAAQPVRGAADHDRLALGTRPACRAGRGCVLVDPNAGPARRRPLNLHNSAYPAGPAGVRFASGPHGSGHDRRLRQHLDQDNLSIRPLIETSSTFRSGNVVPVVQDLPLQRRGLCGAQTTANDPYGTATRVVLRSATANTSSA